MTKPREIAVLGDLHANLSALEAVLSLIDLEDVQEILCVGDLVGYGARPNEVIEVVQDRNIVCVAGNHDWALLGKLSPNYFNPYALAAIKLHQQLISKQNREFLAHLPLRIDDPDFCLFHGALPNPELFNYLQSYPAAHGSLDDFDARVGFCGHTHVPMNFLQSPGNSELEWHFKDDWLLGSEQRAVINVGSPGQPRDENPQSPVLFFNTQSGRIRLLRTPYNIAAEQKLIRKAGLPAILGDRLLHGI